MIIADESGDRKHYTISHLFDVFFRQVEARLLIRERYHLLNLLQGKIREHLGHV